MFKVNDSSQQDLPLSWCFFDYVSSNINKLWLLLCYLRVPFHHSESPPWFRVTHISKDNLVNITPEYEIVFVIYIFSCFRYCFGFIYSGLIVFRLFFWFSIMVRVVLRYCWMFFFWIGWHLLRFQIGWRCRTFDDRRLWRCIVVKHINIAVYCILDLRFEIEDQDGWTLWRCHWAKEMKNWVSNTLYGYCIPINLGILAVLSTEEEWYVICMIRGWSV